MQIHSFTLIERKTVDFPRFRGYNITKLSEWDAVSDYQQKPKYYGADRETSQADRASKGAVVMFFLNSVNYTIVNL